MLAANLRSEARWLAGGFLLTLSSGFGQTYFISLFAGYLKADLAITDGQFGLLYTVGTLGSAVMLTVAGKLADRLPARWLGTGALVALALTSIGMSVVESLWALGLLLFGLRFFGQGMLTHVAMTAMGRWFNRKRGRAVAMAALGFPAAEALLPPAAVALAATIGWRQTWAAGAAALVFISIPALLWLVRRERQPAVDDAAHGGPAAPTPTRHDWTRAQVLRSPLFYALMPGFLAPPLVVTGLFFNQVTIADSKGWPLAWFAAAFPLLALVHLVATLFAGYLIDRFSARRLLPVLLFPLAAAAALVAFAGSPWVLPVFMALIGLTQGGSSTIQGALWPELYGTTHLGSIRAIVVAGIVFSSAIAPGAIGVLLDAGVALEAQLLVLSLYCVAAAALMTALQPALKRQALGR